MDRRQFYKNAGWDYLGTASELHFFASPADSGAEELHTDPQDFAPAIRRQRRTNFWFLLIFSLLMAVMLPLIFLSYPPEPLDWLYLALLILCLAVMLPGLIRDGRWLFQKRWHHLPPVDHHAKVPRFITLRARPLVILLIVAANIAVNFVSHNIDRIGFVPISEAARVSWY